MPSPSIVPKLSKKLEPWKVIIVGVCAIIVSLGSIAALGARYTSALDKKVDRKEFDPVKTDQAAEKALHLELQRRMDRLETKVDDHHDETMNAFGELKSLFRRR